MKQAIVRGIALVLGGMLMSTQIVACRGQDPGPTADPTALQTETAETLAPTPDPDPSRPFDFPENPQTTLAQAYAGVTVVYSRHARLYERNAAEKFFRFVQEKMPAAELVPTKDFQREKEGFLTVYIGQLNLNEIEERYAYSQEGYRICAEEGRLVIKGSNAENTYCAVNTLIYALLHENADVLGSLDRNLQYRYEKQYAREDYIRDISLFQPVWQYEWQPHEWMFDFETKIKDMMNRRARAMAFGHRGDLESYPENSIEGVISAVLRGADAIEIDCFYTRDGVIVLDHGGDLSVTTDFNAKRGKTVNGMTLPTSPKIEDWSYAELQMLNLRAGNGGYSDASCEVSGYKIATLEEAFLVCSERCFLSLDRMESGGLASKDWPNVYALIKKTKAYRCLLYQNMALCEKDANDLRNVIRRDFGTAGPTTFDRMGGYQHNTASDWFAEFDFTTEEEFEAFYNSLLEKGTFIQGNRLSRILDWVDRHYGPDSRPES